MRLGWSWVGVGLVVACSARPVPSIYDGHVKGAESAPGETNGAAASGTTANGATRAHDDPATCVESHEPLAPELAARGPHIDGMSAKLNSCTAGLREAGFVRVSMTPRSGGGTNVTVEESNLHDYRVIECVKRALERSTIQNPGSKPLVASLGFEPDHAPQRTERAEDLPIEHTSHAEHRPIEHSSNVPGDPSRPLGRLPPEKIQKIVRASYDTFRKCYEAGLGRDPHLTGRVAIRFVIDLDGKVSSAQIADNTLPDCAVSACVRDKFKALAFPEPEGGIVTVVYPIWLEPG